MQTGWVGVLASHGRGPVIVRPCIGAVVVNSPMSRDVSEFPEVKLSLGMIAVGKA